MQRLSATQGLLFGSYLFREDLHPSDKFHRHWTELFGDSSSLIPSMNPLTSYYEKEMGPGLGRIFFLTKNTFPREFLLSTKIESLSWEHNWSSQGRRSVNVDIGFLTLENFVLATTKPYSHRIYLGQNIYADLTYIFQRKGVETLPWTYPDYKDDEKKSFFLSGRQFIHSVV